MHTGGLIQGRRRGEEEEEEEEEKENDGKRRRGMGVAELARAEECPPSHAVRIRILIVFLSVMISTSL